MPVSPEAPLILLAVLLVLYLPPALVLAWVDGREHRLPNEWLAAMTAVVGAALLVVALAAPTLRDAVVSAAVLALLAGVGAVLIALVAPPLLGMGDAKAVPVVVVMSAALGGEVLIAAALGIALVAGVVGTAVVAVSRRAGVRFALGPVLLAGPFLGLLGAPLVRSALGTG